MLRVSLFLGGNLAEKEFRVSFALEKETKNCLRYQEITDGYPVVGSLYIQKGALNGDRPARLEVVIRTAGGTAPNGGRIVIKPSK